MKKILALVLAMIVMATALVGCGGGNAGTQTDLSEFGDVDYKVNVEAEKYEDSSDMPDWTGKQLDLVMWYGAGSYSIKRDKISENDVVSPEWQRVTGVKFSDKSYDNNGELQDARLAKIIASNDWPDVLYGCQGNALARLIEEDMLYDLTDLIPKYMPNVNALLEKGDFMKSNYYNGRLYEVDLSAPITYAYPDMDSELLARTNPPKANSSIVYIRDDILKMFKPEAYTMDELEEMFNNNGGKFTPEEILNGSFSSKEEFYQFLRDIKAKGIKSGNREVYATYAFAGSDNWDFLYNLAGNLNGYSVSAAGNNYFTYLDAETERVEYMYNKPFFKEAVKELTELIQEDVIAQDSLIDSRATYEQNCASGLYAVLYGGTKPDINTLNANAVGYKYRPVIINIPLNTEKFVPLVNSVTGGYRYAFVKNKVKEEDLPQILRALDFMLTDVGQKMVEWGPRSAGLFEDTENGRRFTNKEVEDNAVRGVANDAQLKYGLNNKQWPGYPAAANKWQPVYQYEFVPNLRNIQNFYNTGHIEPMETVNGIAPDIWKFTAEIEAASKGWDARTDFENALTKVLTAKNDEEFETLFNAMVETGERDGFTEASLDEINEYWKTNVNAPFMENLEEYFKNK